MGFNSIKDAKQLPLLQEFAVKHIQKAMVQVYGLKEVQFPEDQDVYGTGYSKTPKCNIFMSNEFYSRDAEANAGKTALVLIQGNGEVRAGQWSRSVCVNDGF